MGQEAATEQQLSRKGEYSWGHLIDGLPPTWKFPYPE